MRGGRGGSGSADRVGRERWQRRVDDAGEQLRYEKAAVVCAGADGCSVAGVVL